MALSLLSYFFYLVMAFTTVMVLLVRLFDVPTLQKVRHYQHPILFQATTMTPKVKHRHPSVTLATKDQLAKAVSAQDAKSSGTTVVAKITSERNRRTRHARLDGLMLFCPPG